MTLRGSRSNPDKPAFKPGRPSDALIVHRQRDKAPAGAPRARSDDRLSNLVFEGGPGTRLRVRPRKPDDPMVNPPDPVLALLRRLAAGWRRWMTDKEGF